MIQVIVNWVNEEIEISPEMREHFSSQSAKGLIALYSNSIHHSTTQCETDDVRSRNNKLSLRVHSLNILKNLISSPELTSHFHSYYIRLLHQSIQFLDHPK